MAASSSSFGFQTKPYLLDDDFYHAENEESSSLPPPNQMELPEFEMDSGKRPELVLLEWYNRYFQSCLEEFETFSRFEKGWSYAEEHARIAENSIAGNHLDIKDEQFLRAHFPHFQGVTKAYKRASRTGPVYVFRMIEVQKVLESSKPLGAIANDERELNGSTLQLKLFVGNIARLIKEGGVRNLVISTHDVDVDIEKEGLLQTKLHWLSWALLYLLYQLNSPLPLDSISFKSPDTYAALIFHDRVVNFIRYNKYNIPCMSNPYVGVPYHKGRGDAPPSAEDQDGTRLTSTDLQSSIFLLESITGVSQVVRKGEDFSNVVGMLPRTNVSTLILRCLYKDQNDDVSRSEAEYTLTAARHCNYVELQVARISDSIREFLTAACLNTNNVKTIAFVELDDFATENTNALKVVLKSMHDALTTADPIDEHHQGEPKTISFSLRKNTYALAKQDGELLEIFNELKKHASISIFPQSAHSQKRN